MSINTNFELDTLKDKVSQVYGGRISTTNDFANLAESIDERTGECLSDSTLKRIWGYVNYKPQPHTNTLNVLAKYIGYESFRAFCSALQVTSAFFACEKIIVSDLSVGDVVCIGWGPDREVILEYSGDYRFEVKDGGTSKLEAGDMVETTEFLNGAPQFFGKVIRDSKELPAYVAGKASGLTKVEMVY